MILWSQFFSHHNSVIFFYYGIADIQDVLAVYRYNRVVFYIGYSQDQVYMDEILGTYYCI